MQELSTRSSELVDVQFCQVNLSVEQHMGEDAALFQRFEFSLKSDEVISRNFVITDYCVLLSLVDKEF